MPRKKLHPQIGDAFAFPLDDGRYAVCRILQCNGNNVLAACSSWVGAEIPCASMGELREILRLNHHFHSGSDLIMWVPSNLPKEFVPIGNIKPSDEESSLDCGSYGDLNSITCQPLTQWLWDNDRQAVYEKDEIEEREREGVAQRDSEVRSNYLDHLTLESYSSETPLPNWSGHVDTQIVRRGRKIIRSTVKRLIGLGRNASKANKIDLLTTCMRDLIDLDVRYIDTESRYEVFDDIEALAHACGVPEEAVKIYANRNW